MDTITLNNKKYNVVDFHDITHGFIIRMKYESGITTFKELLKTICSSGKYKQHYLGQFKYIYINIKNGNSIKDLNETVINNEYEFTIW